MTYRSLISLVLAGVLLSTSVFTLAQETTPPAELAASQGLTIHVVQRGENLYRIAEQYGMTYHELAELNGILNVNNIQVGQRLLVPTHENPLPQTHTVQAGETLASIASLYNLDLAYLLAQNQISDANAIYVGQILNITPQTGVNAPPPENLADSGIDISEILPSFSSDVYVVQAGDTLYKIGLKYGLTVNDLSSANSITDPTRIYVGQQLLIPKPESPDLASELPAPISNLSVQPPIFIEGETARVEIQTSVAATVTGQFLGQALRVIPLEGNLRHLMLIAIPNFTETGVYPLSLSIAGTDGSQAQVNANIRIAAGRYGAQNLNVSAEMAELIAPAVQEEELRLLGELMSRFTIERYFDEAFSLPAAAAMNAPYGTRRSYNGGAISSYHSGADFAAAPGTAIYAAAPGQVVLADRLNIRGNTVVIYHGWGIYTLYAHQNTLNVNVGENVVTGQIIGTAGSTGRVTGPHLHWEVWLNGVPVNPLQWVQYQIP